MSFSRDELLRRYDGMRTFLADNDVDALLVTGIENLSYLGFGSGFDNSWAMHLCQANGPYSTVIVIPQTGPATVIVHGLLADVARQAGFPENIRTYFERAPGEAQPCVEMAAQALQDLGVAKGTIALELGSNHPADSRIGVPAVDFLRMKHKLGEAKLVDGNWMLRTMRMVKSAEEISCIRRAAEIITGTFQTCFGEIREGMSETQVVSICNRLVSERGGRPVWTLAKSGPETSVLLPRDKTTLQRGKLLFLDLGVVVDGYHADFNRMAIVGRASESQRNKCDAIAEITRATIAEVKAGVKACEVVDICRAHFKKHGLEPPPGLVSPDRIGHGIGLTLTEAPAIASYDKTVLREGMTFCLEPAIWTEDGYYITEQDVVVRKEGCEALSTADNRLYEID